MSETSTLNPLPPEHKALAREAKRQRRAFQRSPLGTFAREMEDAMTEYLKMRSAGVGQDVALQGLAGIIREFWPCRPARACTTCDGTGWRETVCTHGMRCGRYRCAFAEHAWEHAYVVPCDCPAGDRQRARVPTQEDEIAAVGKTQKPKRGFSRVGRE